jgi:hypothetical protein
MQGVRKFTTIQQAKDFLAKKIESEAEREGMPLSEVERKMLYFSETDQTPADIRTISVAFDRDYDENEYEQKIAALVRTIDARNQTEKSNEQEAWDEAALKLSEGDHYLSVLIARGQENQNIGHGFVPTLVTPTIRPPHDRLKLWITAVIVSIGIFIAMALYLMMGR